MVADVDQQLGSGTAQACKYFCNHDKKTTMMMATRGSKRAIYAKQKYLKTSTSISTRNKGTGTGVECINSVRDNKKEGEEQ